MSIQLSLHINKNESETNFKVVFMFELCQTSVWLKITDRLVIDHTNDLQTFTLLCFLIVFDQIWAA